MVGRRLVTLVRVATAAAVLVALTAVTVAFIIAHTSSSPKSFIMSTVSAHDVVIFSDSYCPHDKIIKDFFKELQLKKEPYVVELDQRVDRWEIQNALMHITTLWPGPHVFIHGKHLGVSELFNILLRDTDQVSFRGKDLDAGAVQILLRLARVENWVNFV